MTTPGEEERGARKRERADPHLCQRRRWADLDEAFELVLSEEQILSLDPTNLRREPVGQQLPEDDVRQLLTLLNIVPSLLISLAQNPRQARRRNLVVDELGVLFRDLEQLGLQDLDRTCPRACPRSDGQR